MKNFIDNDFSLEDVNNGIYAAYKEPSVGSKIIYDLGIKEFADSITDRSNEDYISYGIEAYNNYNEAQLLGNFATESLNAINEDIYLISKIKDTFGIESLDPYSFSAEFKNPFRKGEKPPKEPKAPKSGKGDKNAPVAAKTKEVKRNIFSRIFSAIALAFKRLIMTIGNWIRSLLNWLKGKMFQGTIKFYTAHANEFPNLVAKYGDTTIKGVAAVDPKFATNMVKTLNVEAMEKLTAATDKAQGEAEKIIKDIEAGKTYNPIKIFGRFLRRNNASAVFETYGELLYDAMSLGSPAVKAWLKKSGKAAQKIGAPAKVASLMMWGKEKPTKGTVSIKALVGDKGEGFIVLSQANMDNIKQFVKSGEKCAKGLQNSYKTTLQSAKAVESALKSVADQKKYNAINEHVHSITNLANVSRTLNLYLVGFLLNFHKEYFRYASYIGSAARLLVKKGGGGGDKKGKDKSDNKKEKKGKKNKE
jgi:hypothetical protein